MNIEVQTCATLHYGRVSPAGAMPCTVDKGNSAAPNSVAVG